MLTYATILFALGAAGGAAMALMHFKGKTIPMGLAIVHGLLGASGLLFLGAFVFGDAAAGSRLTLALGLFVAAALGGFALFANHLRGRALPSALILVHAAVAVVAFLLLLSAIL